MEKLRHCCALLGVATLSFGWSVAFFAERGHAADPVKSDVVQWPSASERLASLRVSVKKPKVAQPKKKVTRHRVVVGHHIGTSP
ncbi:MAG TPA: hypothetical protein VGL84_05185, partial [Gaiellaceae bacterium]